jgi:LacI family transcriptional regulator
MAKVTMQNIADQLGLSRFAVSRALNGGEGVSEDTRRRVLEVAERLGYIQPGAVRNKDSFRTRNILFMVGEEKFTEQAFWPHVIAGVEMATRQRHLNLMIAVISQEHDLNGVVPTALLQNYVDGALAVGEFQLPFLEAISKQKRPIVLVDMDGFETKFDAVITADIEGGFIAVKHLAGLNHQSIGFVGDLSFASSFRRRYQGFLIAKQQLGLCNDRELALTNYVESHYWDLAEVKSKLSKAEHLPTGFVCANDKAAIVLMTALLELGLKVPEDVSVVGFDNINLAATCSPALTTINVHKERMGEKAMELLEWRINNPSAPRETVNISTEIIIRDSTTVAKENV